MPSARLRSTSALTKRMRELDRTHASLARQSGCSRQFIWRLATGKISSCSAEMAFTIEEVLQVDTGALFARSSEPVTRRKIVSKTGVAA